MRRYDAAVSKSLLLSDSRKRAFGLPTAEKR
jgi:hypothetical protein